MASSHPLDRPVWSALTSGWSHLARGDRHALRLDPAYGPFAAAADGSAPSLGALAALVPPSEPLWVVELSAAELKGLKVQHADCAQMVADSIMPGEDEVTIIALTESDAPEMRALAHLTRPGPFLERTHQLSQFLGVKVDGRLAAMAGERMRLPGFSEVSGVCTHPDMRGRGYAGALMRAVGRRVLARGEVPFLHAYAANRGAIGLYEQIGFRTRTPVVLSAFTRP